MAGQLYSQFYVLDLDRTLLDTIKATELMRGVIALHDAELAARLEQRFEDYSASGESFSMRDFIAENVNEDEILQIEAKFKEVAAEWDLLNPGAEEFLAYLRSREDVGFGILTYGSALGQTMKIRAVAVLSDVPFLITLETYKGAQIAAWREDDGIYSLPAELGGGRTKKIVFVDDKPFSFKGLPIDCKGYLVKSVYDAGIEKLPHNVVQVDTLTHVLTAEKQLNVG